MKILKYPFYVFAFAAIIMACNNEQSDRNSTKKAKTEMHDGSHEGHDHSQDGTSSEKDKSGPEYTSKYVCPMHCEGSGSEEPGKCPVCGMDYVLNDEE